MGKKVNKNIRNLLQNDKNNLKITLDEKEEETEREEKLAGWEKAVKYSFGWAKN